MSSLTIIQLILVLAGIVVFALVVGFVFGAVFTFGTYVAEQWINRYRWWRYEKKQAKESAEIAKNKKGWSIMVDALNSSKAQNK